MKERLQFTIGLSFLVIGAALIGGTAANGDVLGLLMVPVPLVLIGSFVVAPFVMRR